MSPISPPADSSVFSSRTSRIRSIRNEMRLLLGLVVSGFIVQVWATIGQFTMKEVLNGFLKVTRFVVMRCFFAWALWVTVLCVYLWETHYVKRHYSKAEWGASLQTLDSFDGPDGDWSRMGPDLLLRGTALGYRDPAVTPYLETYNEPSDTKGYDRPPNDWSKTSPPESLVTTSAGRRTTELPSACHPSWKGVLPRGDCILGPHLSSKGPPESKRVGMTKALVDSYKKVGLSSDFTNTERVVTAPRRWVPEDRYWSEKVQIIQESFGPTLCRTRSM